MYAWERFIEYVKICTASSRTSQERPSTLQQFDLAHQLVYELKELGLADVNVNKHCLVYGKLPATKGLENAPRLGLVAHLDTHPDCPGSNVKPYIIEKYNGQDITLPATGEVLSVDEFPHLLDLRGETLILSSGDTLLGADDKAGIAEILTALEKLICSQKPHGPVRIAFIPDEEIGAGTDYFDMSCFDADYAYTVDGCRTGEITVETFNGTKAFVHICGKDIHTGDAKGIMINSQLVALEFAGLLPESETPSKTSGREGFYHLLRSHGTVNETVLTYSIRDFSAQGMAGRIEFLKSLAEKLNQKYGENTVSITFKEEYRNMKEQLDSCPWLVEKAVAACWKAGVEPSLTIARGGTVGSRLINMGLPCPSLGVGGYSYHSTREHITAENMERVATVLEELILEFAE